MRTSKVSSYSCTHQTLLQEKLCLAVLIGWAEDDWKLI